MLHTQVVLVYAYMLGVGTPHSGCVSVCIYAPHLLIVSPSSGIATVMGMGVAGPDLRHR